MEEILKDKFNNSLRLTEQQWKHIIQQHPEMIPHRKRVAEVILNPEIVKRSKRDKDIFLYYLYYSDIYKGKYLLVVARTKNTPEVLTCYITDRIKEGDMIWKKD